MKFLVDAQLPKALAEFLCEKEYVAIHTLHLPDKNRTTDKQIIEISAKDIVITKDDDFLQAHLIKNEPKKLILNSKLLEIFSEHILKIENILSQNLLIEIHRDEIIIHSSKN